MILLAVCLLRIPPALAEAPASYDDLDPENWREWPVVPNFVTPELKALYHAGLEEGNHPGHFSKVGDSNTITGAFFGCFDGGEGAYDLGPYASLQETIDRFQWSFSRVTRAAKNGATAYDMDVYHWYEDEVCWPYESATTCEYRLYSPSIAFIAFGTNDALLNIDLYEEHLRSLVQKSLDRKIVPILVTKMDDLEGDGSFNRMTAQIAKEMGVPLWNLWAAMRPLPNFGLKERDVHPTSDEFALCNFTNGDELKYGWTMRNLTGLQTLNQVYHLLNAPES